MEIIYYKEILQNHLYFFFYYKIHTGVTLGQTFVFQLTITLK